MYVKKDVQIVNEQEMGLFDKLPDDLVLSNILSRIDLKTLCQRLIVSKGFASIIYRTGKVTIIADDDAISHWNSESYKILLRKVLYSTREEIIESNIMGFTKSLEKFRELKFIRVEFTSHEFSPIRMRLLCRSIESQVQSMLVVVPKSIRKMSNQFEEAPLDEENPIEFMESENEKGWDWYQGIGEWAVVMLLLIKCHGQLESITIACSSRRRNEKDEVFVMKGENLVEWRDLLLFKQFPPKNQMVDDWFLAAMHSPVSKYLMSCTIVISLATKALDDDSGDDLVTWQYHGEKELLAEASKCFVRSVQHGMDIREEYTDYRQKRAELLRLEEE